MSKLRVITPYGKLFPNPYVVKLVWEQYNIPEFIRILQQAKKMYTIESWAYSSVSAYSVINPDPPALVINGHSFPGNGWEEKYISYWAFSDEQDALQFRIKFDDSTHAVIWPHSIKFTIIDYV